MPAKKNKSVSTSASNTTKDGKHVIQLEGGGFMECGRHNFRTTIIEDWNDHWDDGDHYDIVTTVCNQCKEPIEAMIPFVRLTNDGSKTPNMPVLICNDCKKNFNDKAKITKLSKIRDTKQKGD